VRLDGALRTPETGRQSRLGLDLVICHHGVGGNFYNPYFFDDLGSLLLAQGCAVLRKCTGELGDRRGRGEHVDAQAVLLGVPP
jgi:hypothetical protein